MRPPERERDPSFRERKNKTAEKRERNFSSSLFSLFLCFLQIKRGVEDPSCGSESVAVKKGGHKARGEEIFFFCSDIHSFALSYLQKQGITTRTTTKAV